MGNFNARKNDYWSFVLNFKSYLFHDLATKTVYNHFLIRIIMVLRKVIIKTKSIGYHISKVSFYVCKKKTHVEFDLVSCQTFDFFSFLKSEKFWNAWETQKSLTVFNDSWNIYFIFIHWYLLWFSGNNLVCLFIWGYLLTKYPSQSAK